MVMNAIPEPDGFLMDEPTWAQRVKTVRLKLNVTQAQLAEQLKVDPATMARWEKLAYRPWSEASNRFILLEEELEREEPS